MGMSVGGFMGAEALKTPLSREARGLANQLKMDQLENTGLLPKGSGTALAKLLGATPYSLN